MTEKELNILNKLADLADKQILCGLDDSEKKTVHSIIDAYTKPKSGKP